MANTFLFDFDGVVINSKKLMSYAFVESVKRLLPDADPPLKAFLAESGNSLPNIINKLNLPIKVVDYFREISIANISMIEIFDGIPDVLSSLRLQKIKTAVVTGKDKYRTLQILDHFNLAQYFDAVISPEDIRNPKPAPDCYVKALEVLKSQNTDAVSFGDAPNDMVASKKAGVYSVGVNWGLFDEDTLWKAGANVVIRNVKDILQFSA